MPRKSAPRPTNSLRNYFAPTPSRPSQNAAFASSPAAPSTIQETPTTDPTAPLRNATLHETCLSSLSSPLVSRSPSPTAPRDIATYDGTAERGTPGLPQSSGNSTNASKRTFSEGRQVVLNSDSDSDSLPDLDDLLDNHLTAKTKAAARTAPVRKREEPKAHRLPPPPKRLKDDKAFKRLVQAAQRNAQMEQEIAEAQAELDKPLREDSPERDPRISEKMVADAVHGEDDPDKAKKLYLAMQRTNAFRVDCVFHFFNRQPDDLDQPFPLETLEPLHMVSTFQDESSRDQAFLSGFAKLLFSRELPKELADWMIDEVCVGASEALSHKYLEILSTNNEHLKVLLDVARIDEIFISLGADKQYIKSDSEVAPSYGSDSGKRRNLPPALVNICKLLQISGSLLQTEARRRILKILFLICMDEGVQTDNAVLHAVQDAIESLICPIPNTSEIASMLDGLVSDLLLRVKHPILQHNLVNTLPSRCPLTASIQRYLALSFLLHPTRITHPLTSPETLSSIHNHLQKSPNFRVNKKTDYTILAARFTLLDIAIGPGPLIVPFQLMASPSASQESQEQSPVEAPKPTSGEVKVFNREVDALAQRIRLVGNSIHVAGAITDLSRLTASDACDRLRTRLQHVIRIGGKRMNNIFGMEEESEDDMMTLKNYFNRKKKEPLSLGGMSVGKDENHEVVVATSDVEGVAVEGGLSSAEDNAIKPEEDGERRSHL